MKQQSIQEIFARPTITVDEAAQVLGISRQSAYEAVRSGELAHITIGRRKLVLSRPLAEKLGISGNA